MVYAQLIICPGEWDAQISQGFWDTNGSSNLGQTTRPSDSRKKKKRENQLNSGPYGPGRSQSENKRKRKYR